MNRPDRLKPELRARASGLNNRICAWFRPVLLGGSNVTIDGRIPSGPAASEDERRYWNLRCPPKWRSAGRRRPCVAQRRFMITRPGATDQDSTVRCLRHCPAHAPLPTIGVANPRQWRHLAQPRRSRPTPSLPIARNAAASSSPPPGPYPLSPGTRSAVRVARAMPTDRRSEKTSLT